ncbi:MAG: hypothetical protein LBF93_03660 [Zoogloeaceae bacterium]|jgi:hypothetical protein|nr:hypothetical protein [Zoogloeaceae bacterium]
MVKLLKLVGVLLLLGVAVFLVRNRGVSLDLNQFSASMGENEVQQALPDLGLKCTGTEPGFSLGSRVCHANLDAFNGIETKQIAFFFKRKRLANFKIDVPWQSHRAMIDKLNGSYGLPTSEQARLHGGVRLAVWKIEGGYLHYDLEANQSASPWNTLLWVSHEEAGPMSGKFSGK